MMNPEPEEYELAMRARAGDRDALADLVERTRLRLFALAYAEIRHYEDAQDAVSAALVQICLHIKEIQQPEKVRAWMQSIVRNECRRLRRCDPGPMLALDETDLLAPEDETLPLRLDIERALRRLPDRLARTIRLFYLESAPISEIARLTGHPAGTIKYWLHQGRQQLSQLMEGYAPMSNSTIPEPIELPRTEPPPGEAPHAMIVQTELDPGILAALKKSVMNAGFEPEIANEQEIKRVATWSEDGAAILERWWGDHEMLILDERLAERPVIELLVNARAAEWDESGEEIPRKEPTICLLLSNPPDGAMIASWSLGVDILLNKSDPDSIDRFDNYARRLARRRGLTGPQPMWTRFSNHAKAAIIEAQAISARLGCRRVAPEHTLAALAEQRDTRAVSLLRKAGADPAGLRLRLDQELQSSAKSPVDVNEVTLSPRMKRAFDFAYAESWQSNSSIMDTEHLLIGIAREPGGFASHMLQQAGITALWLRNEIRPEPRYPHPG